MKKGLLKKISVALTLIATLVASSACLWGFYQPEEPEALREE